jgi:outer membrane protein assembly factor BamB
MNRSLLWAVGILAGCLAGAGFLGCARVEEPVVAEEASKARSGVDGESKTPAATQDGGSLSRNFANLTEKGILGDFSTKKGAEKHVRWSTRLGSNAYGGPVVAGGRVFIGTNNSRPRDPKIKGDKGILLCLRESDGQFLWQAVHDKLPDHDLNDYAEQGVASTPWVDGNRLYYVSNRCELVCADVAGDEKTGKAKILWSYDMVGKLGVFPCQLANSSPLVAGDLVYAITGNGVDISKNTLPAPKAPSFVALNKKTGELVWKSDLPSAKTIRGQWSSPAAAKVDGKMQVLFAGGDGWMYGLDALTGELIWKFDCNPKKAKPYKPGGAGEQCFIIAVPVVYDNKCYIAVGQEPDNDGPGVGHLWCIDITKKPANKDKDLSPVNDNFDPKDPVNKDSGLVWHFGGPEKPGADRDFVFSRTLGSVAAVDGLVYAADILGIVYCLDARTGKKLWEHDMLEGTWCSPYYVDGKVYIGGDSGTLFVFQHGKKLQEPKKISLGSGMAVRVPPVAANGVLYVNGNTALFAIAAGK